MTPPDSAGDAVAVAVQRFPEVKPEHALFERRVVCLLGLPFDLIDMAGAVERVREAARRGEPCFVSTPNLNYIVTALRDTDFRDSVIASDLSLADGMSVMLVARLCGVDLPERVPGSGLLEALCAGPADKPLTVYFFGGPDGVAEKAAQRINAKPQGLVCVGYESPGFGTVEELSRPETIDRINASGADFLVVSLSAKKGQEWIVRNRAQLEVPVVSHLGAALNFIAGTVRRAPSWMQRSGLEWLWRIKEEPALWQRYLADGTVLVRLLALQVLPLAIWLRQRPLQRDYLNASLRIHNLKDVTVIQLRGAWDDRNLGLIREALRTAFSMRRSVRLDLSAVTHVDSRFVGLLLVAQRLMSRYNAILSCRSVPKLVRRAFTCSCVPFLMSR